MVFSKLALPNRNLDVLFYTRWVIPKMVHGEGGHFSGLCWGSNDPPPHLLMYNQLYFSGLLEGMRENSRAKADQLYTWAADFLISVGQF